jgi:hypothetical protein
MEWRRLHNEELHDLYYSPNINGEVTLREFRCEGYEACMERRGEYWCLVEKSEGKEQPGK